MTMSKNEMKESFLKMLMIFLYCMVFELSVMFFIKILPYEFSTILRKIFHPLHLPCDFIEGALKDKTSGGVIWICDVLLMTFIWFYTFRILYFAYNKFISGYKTTSNRRGQ